MHRTINLEERKLSGELIARRQIEIWQSAELGITARRLRDDKGYLIKGDWRRRDGVQTLYAHGSKPKLQTRNPQSAIRDFEDVWQLDPSAKDFASLIGVSERAHVEERPGSYVITYESDPGNERGMVKASLTLSRVDLHATELTLIVRESDQTVRHENANRQSAIGNWQLRQYRFLEASIERRAPSTVAPKVFEPEPELIPKNVELGRSGDAENVSVSPSLPVNASPVATADLEVEVLRLLNSAGADLGEQVSVNRTSEGELKIQGLVDTDQRKKEILRALAPVANNAAVKIDISTFSEALARQKQVRAAKVPPTSGANSAERIESTGEVFPAYSELRGQFSDEEARRYATATVRRSHEAMRHAWALKRLLQQFSAEDLRTLSPEARKKWRALIRSHAAAFGRQTAQLRQQLAPTFFRGAASEDGASQGAISSDEDLLRVVERLIALASANDQVITTAFTISTNGSDASAMRSAQFFRSLRSAEKLAQAMNQYRER